MEQGLDRQIPMAAKVRPTILLRSAKSRSTGVRDGGEPVKRFMGLGVIVVVAAVGPAAVAGQEFMLPQAETVAAAEAVGAEFARPDVAPDLPPLWDEPLGSSERVCVDVTREMTMVRSGEIVIGGFLSQLQAPGPNKVWWKPLNGSLNMTIDITSRSLDGKEGDVAFEIGAPSAPYTNDRPPQPIPEEAFFPGGAYFPSAGRWIAVASSGDNWGCFVFHVPEGPPPPLGG